jgi:hypothetical protein
MKPMSNTLVSFIFLLSFVICGCSDKGTSVDPEVSKISGEWIWVKRTGGFFPRLITPDSGLVLKDVYLPNGSFHRFRNDTLLVHAHFTISKVNSLNMLVFTDVRS